MSIPECKHFFLKHFAMIKFQLVFVFAQRPSRPAPVHYRNGNNVELFSFWNFRDFRGRYFSCWLYKQSNQQQREEKFIDSLRFHFVWNRFPSSTFPCLPFVVRAVKLGGENSSWSSLARSLVDVVSFITFSCTNLFIYLSSCLCILQLTLFYFFVRIPLVHMKAKLRNFQHSAAAGISLATFSVCGENVLNYAWNWTLLRCVGKQCNLRTFPWI